MDSMERMAAKYGTVEFGGQTYTLTGSPDDTNRVFPGWWGDAADGEPYTAEWSAPAIGEDGLEYRVVWQWEEIRGEELEDAGGYDWSDASIDRVEPI